MIYKYAVGHLFTISVNTKKYIGKIIKIADIDEFGGDFHYEEKNYVVQFNVNNIQLATYNIMKNTDPIEYDYIMNEEYIDIKTNPCI
jgi:hypothetical protein